MYATLLFSKRLSICKSRLYI